LPFRRLSIRPSIFPGYGFWFSLLLAGLMYVNTCYICRGREGGMALAALGNGRPYVPGSGLISAAARFHVVLLLRRQQFTLPFGCVWGRKGRHSRSTPRGNLRVRISTVPCRRVFFFRWALEVRCANVRRLLDACLPVMLPGCPCASPARSVLQLCCRVTMITVRYAVGFICKTPMFATVAVPLLRQKRAGALTTAGA